MRVLSHRDEHAIPRRSHRTEVALAPVPGRLVVGRATSVGSGSGPPRQFRLELPVLQSGKRAIGFQDEQDAESPGCSTHVATAGRITSISTTTTSTSEVQPRSVGQRSKYSGSMTLGTMDRLRVGTRPSWTGFTRRSGRAAGDTEEHVKPPRPVGRGGQRVLQSVPVS